MRRIIRCWTAAPKRRRRPIFLIATSVTDDAPQWSGSKHGVGRGKLGGTELRVHIRVSHIRHITTKLCVVCSDSVGYYAPFPSGESGMALAESFGSRSPRRNVGCGRVPLVTVYLAPYTFPSAILSAKIPGAELDERAIYPRWSAPTYALADVLRLREDIARELALWE
jgi:hypothetical protein